MKPDVIFEPGEEVLQYGKTVPKLKRQDQKICKTKLKAQIYIRRTYKKKPTLVSKPRPEVLLESTAQHSVHCTQHAP
jgi:hypothetical protein